MTVSDLSSCYCANGIRANEVPCRSHVSHVPSDVCSCSAQSCFKLMEVCQRPHESGKVVRGSLAQPLSHPGQVSLPAPCAPTANTSKLVKPGVNPRPYNHTRSNGSVHPAPKIEARSEDGKPMSSKKEEANCRINRCAETGHFLLISNGTGLFEGTLFECNAFFFDLTAMLELPALVTQGTIRLICKD